MMSIHLRAVGPGGTVRDVRMVTVDESCEMEMAGYIVADAARRIYLADDETVEVQAMDPHTGTDWTTVYPYRQSADIGRYRRYRTADEVHLILLSPELADQWDTGLAPSEVAKVGVITPIYERGLAGSYLRPLSPWDEWAEGTGIEPDPE